VTDIEFRIDLEDKLGYAVRLARKYALTGQPRLVVTGAPPVLDALDAALWNAGAAEFPAHCRSGAPDEVLRRSPVVLADAVDDALPRDVLLNLGDAVPPGFERFERLIELVGTAEDDRAAGRVRWTHYKHRGYSLRHQSAFGGRA